MTNLEAINLAEEEGVELTYKGYNVDPFPHNDNEITLVHISEPNENNLSDHIILVVSTKHFLNTILTKKGKF